MDMEIFFGLGALVVFGYLYYIINNKPSESQTSNVHSHVEDEIDTILNSDKYKVKGRFEE
ncbi:hypothetical protein K9M79_02280 [Candidatus Woesearchaeota archaeon]|nr:hypothetical protein [Candidatus Woesearchaeota archaeon]